MQGQDTSTLTSEQAFCAAITCLAQTPQEASAVEGGHKQGLCRGLVLLSPLHELLTQQTGKCLSLDRFATHLVQFTRNQVKVSIEKYWEGERWHEEAYVVQHPSKKPMCLAKLLEILRTCGTSIWLARSAGVEGQRLMHALQQPSLELACDTSQQRLEVLAQQPQLLAERQAVISQRLRAQQGSAGTSSSPALGRNHAARLRQADDMPCSASSHPAAGSSQAAELQQPEESQSDLIEDTQQRQTVVQQAEEVQTDQGRPDEERQGQGLAQERLTDGGLAGGVQGDRGQIGQADDDTAVEAEQGGGGRRRVTRASARQEALVLDMHHSEHDSGLSSARAVATPDLDLAAGIGSLTEQDSFYTASAGIAGEDGTPSKGSAEAEDLRCQASHQEGCQGSDGDGEEVDSTRSWESLCPQAFPWDKKSSLMVCVDGEKKIWYQAHVVGIKNSQYLLSWPAYPDRPQEWVDKNSRRIWREDQVKREYWNQQAAAFRESKNRAWVLKACYWQWQMSSRSDFLPVPHRDTADRQEDACAGTCKPRPLRVEALRQDSQDSPQSQAPAKTPATMDLGRGFCVGCWTTKWGLQSVCGKCRVGACHKCRALWEEKRKYGTTTDEAGLMVNQSNICFCGGHLTPRGAAAYDRKGKRRHPPTLSSRSSK